MILQFLDDITYNPKYEILKEWAKDNHTDYMILFKELRKYTDFIFHNKNAYNALITLRDIEENAKEPTEKKPLF